MSLLARVALVTALAVAVAAAAPAGASWPGQLPPGWPDAPSVTAEAYVLADLSSGQLLAARHPDRKRPVASTVKILTALTVLGRSRLDDEVVVGPEVRAVPGAGVGLQPGDRTTVAALLEGLVARSGNDAAVTLAHHVAGSVPAFVELMRRQAADLGLTDLRLRTPHGLDDRNLLSARDLAVLARAAMADQRFRAVAGRAEVTLPRIGTVPSRNDLLATLDGATGIKTGYTAASGWSVVASVRHAGTELVAVVLGADGPGSRFRDARRLFEHGFGQFTRRELRLSRRLAAPGPDLVQTVAGLGVHAPTGEDAVLQAPVAPDIPADGTEVPVVWRRGTLVHAVSRVTGGGGPTATGASSPGAGATLLSRTYAAMRTAHRADLWPRPRDG